MPGPIASAVHQQLLDVLGNPVLARLVMGDKRCRGTKRVSDAVHLLHTLYLTSDRQPADAALCNSLFDQWLTGYGYFLQGGVRCPDMGTELLSVEGGTPVWLHPSTLARVLAVDIGRSAYCVRVAGKVNATCLPSEIHPFAQPLIDTILDLDSRGEGARVQLRAMVSVLRVVLVDVVLGCYDRPQSTRNFARTCAMVYVCRLVGLTDSVAWDLLERCRAFLKPHACVGDDSNGDNAERFGDLSTRATVEACVATVETLLAQQTTDRACWILDHWSPLQFLDICNRNREIADRSSAVVHAMAAAAAYPDRNPVATLFRSQTDTGACVESVLAKFEVPGDHTEDWLVLTELLKEMRHCNASDDYDSTPFDETMPTQIVKRLLRSNWPDGDDAAQNRVMETPYMRCYMAHLQDEEWHELRQDFGDTMAYWHSSSKTALRQLLRYLPPAVARDLMVETLGQLGRGQKRYWCVLISELSRLCDPEEHRVILGTATGAGGLAPPLTARCFNNE